MSRIAKSSDVAPKGKRQRATPSKLPKLSVEQQKRLTAFREFVQWKNEQWASMTPKQQREADRKWELFKKSMNEARPDRPPYPNE